MLQMVKVRMYRVGSSSLTPKWVSCWLQVGGIKCVSCGMRIKQHVLSHVKGVQNCTVEFEKGHVMVSGKGVSQTQLLEAISSLGYVPRIISFKEHAPPVAKKSPTSQRGSEL